MKEAGETIKKLLFQNKIVLGDVLNFKNIQKQLKKNIIQHKRKLYKIQLNKIERPK